MMLFGLFPRQRLYSRLLGFSLVELSVVIMIMSVVLGGGLAMITRNLESAKEKVTQQRLDEIERALMAYRIVNGRLPCPADGSIAQGVSNYGVEADVPGTCTGGTVEANFDSAAGQARADAYTTQIVGGTVPTVTLGLRPEQMYDGWGRRISYHVDAKATEPAAFSKYTISQQSCFEILVDDEYLWTAFAGGNERNFLTTHGLYVLLSHGKNGHGAYTAGGSRHNAASTNTLEQENADYSSAGAATAYDNLFVDIAPTIDPADSANSFDDYVRFKTRAQLRTDLDGVGHYFPDLVVATNQGLSPPLYYYSRCGDRFVQEIPQQASHYYLGMFDVAITPDNGEVLTANYANYFDVWEYDGVTSYAAPTTSFSSRPATDGGGGNRVFWGVAGDTKFFTIASIDVPAWTAADDGVALYRQEPDGTYTFIDDPFPDSAMLSGGPYASISPDGELVILTSLTSSFVPEVHSRNIDFTYDEIGNPTDANLRSPWHPVLAAGFYRAAQWSPDGKYVVLFNNALTGKMGIFRRNGDNTFTQLSNPATVPTNNFSATDMKPGVFSPDSKYLVVMEDTAAGTWHIYKRSGDTFTRLTTHPAVLPAAGRAAAFSHDGMYLAVGFDASSANGTTANINIYKRTDEDTFTLLSSPSGPVRYPLVAPTAMQFRHPFPWEQKE